MNLIRTQGNLIKLAFEGKFDAIVHGCNCFNNMGAGIALSIASKFPQAYAIDQSTVKGDFTKLGNYTSAKAFTKTNPVKTFLVINAYTQYGCDARASVDKFEYTAFELILQKLAYKFPEYRFGLPYIGMGLAGGKPEKIIPMIENFAHDLCHESSGTVTLVEYK